MSGLYGRTGRTGLQAKECSILIIFLFFGFSVQGDSHPRLCAQRDDEGDGFLLLWS
jgi:hypothetical protein